MKNKTILVLGAGLDFYHHFAGASARFESIVESKGGEIGGKYPKIGIRICSKNPIAV